MPQAVVATKVKPSKNKPLLVEVKNTGKTIAFFLQLQVKDEQGKSVKPCFMTDNFFSLLPGERKTVSIDASLAPVKAAAVHLRGWNVASQIMRLKSK